MGSSDYAVAINSGSSSRNGTPTVAGLTPGNEGLYQVNGNVPTGDNLPVVLQQNGIESNPVPLILISIRP